MKWVFGAEYDLKCNEETGFDETALLKEFLIIEDIVIP